MAIFNLRRGFTLIELLITIAVLGILATGVLVALDPIDRINQANDARVISGVGLLGRAAETYSTLRGGVYPASEAQLVATGDLRSGMNPPSGYAYFVIGADIAGDEDVGCTGGPSGNTCENVIVIANLISKRYRSVCTNPALPFQRFQSVNGKTCQVCANTQTLAVDEVCP